MNWYYSIGGEKFGPVELSEISSLVFSGTITNDTLLWRNGMPDWKLYGELVALPELFEDTDYAICVESGNLLLKENMVRVGDAYVAAEFNDAYMRKNQEGAAEAKDLVFAGFWIRFVAKFADNIILGVLNFVILLGVGLVIGISSAGIDPEANPEAFAMMSVVIMLISYAVMFALGALYNLIFLPKYGATPGKMACGIKVVNPDGSYISKVKAVGRYFAELLSGLIFLIGYIIAAFDNEKRSLHDRICDTRVVEK